jgi:hypothetical protein
VGGADRKDATRFSSGAAERSDVPRAGLQAAAAATGLVSVLLLLAFCGLRWVTVAHFGLVSFGGPNQAGMAANSLDGRVVRELPQEHQRLARNMLKMRRKRGWEAMHPSSSTLDYSRSVQRQHLARGDTRGSAEIQAAQRTARRSSAAGGWNGATRSRSAERDALATLIGLLTLGAGYFAAYLLLVSLVSFPFTRYFVSLTVFLPSALCAQILVPWQRILPSIHPLR